MGGEIVKTGANITKQANTIVVNATNGDIDLSSAKSIVQSSDSKINHGSYRQPEGVETKELLVTKVEGSDKVFVGRTHTFEAVKFSRKPIGGELEKVKWAFKIDDGEIKEFKKPGRVIGTIVRKEILMDDSLYDNEKLTVFAYLQGPSEDASTESEIQVIVVTTSGGKYLFTLEPTEEHPADKLTAKELYDKGVQWFCPEADNYLKLLHMDPDIATFSELKHFTWQSVVTFSEVDRMSLSFAPGLAGDWKQAPTGGDGYLLVTVGGYPYWTDGIGQIPFTVDTYRGNLADGKSHEEAIKSTLTTGQVWADGYGPFGTADYSKSFDNLIILRTCLWARSRYSVRKVTRRFLPDTIEVQTTSHSPDKLGIPLTKQQVDPYFK